MSPFNPPPNLSSRASTTFPPVRAFSHTWKYNTRGVSDNCISRLVTALGGGTISVTLCAVVLQPRKLRGFVPECYLGAFNRKGGARGRFREIGALANVQILRALYTRENWMPYSRDEREIGALALRSRLTLDACRELIVISTTIRFMLSALEIILVYFSPNRLISQRASCVQNSFSILTHSVE